jgi:putative hydrolase of the HAD superfamily
MIKAVIFDCFGVLTTDKWRAFLDSLPPEVNIRAASDLNRAYNTGLIDAEQFKDELKKITGRLPEEPEDLLREDMVKNTILLEYIRSLKPAYKIGLLSNIASNWIRDSFLTEEEQGLFDTMVLSFEVGMTKPDPRIFTLATERLRVTPEEAVLIDDIDTYVEAAKAEGMQGIVYQDMEQAKTELEHLLNTQD